MLAFCNFEKYQEYTFLHKTQEILSILPDPLLGGLVCMASLLHVLATPDWVVRMAIWREAPSA